MLARTSTSTSTATRLLTALTDRWYETVFKSAAADVIRQWRAAADQTGHDRRDPARE